MKTHTKAAYEVELTKEEAVDGAEKMRWRRQTRKEKQTLRPWTKEVTDETDKADKETTVNGECRQGGDLG